MSQPIKSAFAPMRPTVAPSDSTAPAAVPASTSAPGTSPEMTAPACAPSGDTDQQPASLQCEEPTKIVSVELQIRIVHNEEKTNIGYSFLSERPLPKTRTIVGCLNRANQLAERALRSSDAKLVGFLWGCMVSELLLSRRGRDPAVRSCFDYLMEKLQPVGPYVTAIASALATRLASPFKNAGGIYGPTAPKETGYVSVAELLVPMPKSIAGQPWGRQQAQGGSSNPPTQEKRILGQPGSPDFGQPGHGGAE